MYKRQFPNKLKRYVKKYKADLGISLDGDADRIIMCDEKGSIIDGDQIIAALALFWKKKKRLNLSEQMLEIDT